MADIEKNLRSEARLEFLSESGFWDRSLNVKLLLFLLFVLVTFYTLHFRDVKMEPHELGSEARSYAFAQVPFEFYDHEATTFAQREALRDVGIMYLLDEKLIDRRLRDIKRVLHDFTPSMQELDGGMLLPTKSLPKDVSYDDVVLAVTLIVNSCKIALFADPKTFLKLQRHGIDTDTLYPLEGVSDHESLYLPQKIWEQIFDAAFEGRNIPYEAQALAKQYFIDENWSFQAAVSQERQIRDQILDQVPEKYVKIKAGHRIIDQGERVNERHLRMFRALKEALKKQTQREEPLSILASLLISASMIALLGLTFFSYYRDIFVSNRQIFIIGIVYFTTLAFSKVVERLFLDSSFGYLSVVDSVLFVPMATLLSLSLFPVGASILLSLQVLMVLTFSLPVNSENFALINFVGLLVTLSSRRELQHRRYIFFTCAKLWVACSILHFALRVHHTPLFDPMIWQDFAFLFLSLAVSGIFALILLPVLEHVFQIMTDMTLMDYLDPNKELLRRLSIEAPGTYQHSVLVAHLAEVAATSVGARALFCRVSALYHDIGKLAFPHYFAENQQGVNVHQLLTPLESAQVIIAHVSEGVAIARKQGLPEPFIDIIKEHHGTGLVHYFYEKAKEFPKQDFDEKDFRYCGPKPRSKEAVIVMLADCLEAAARSMSEVDEEKLTMLMESIVRHKIADNQLDHATLTLHELSTVKKNLVKTLLAATHSRIKYPGLAVGNVEGNLQGNLRGSASEYIPSGERSSYPSPPQQSS